MKFLVVVSCLLAVAYAKPGVVAPVAYNAVVPSSYGYSYSSHVATAPVTTYAAHSVAAPVAYAAHSVAAPVAYAAHSVAAPVAYSAHSVAAPVAYSTHSVVAPAVAHSVVAPAVAHTVVAPAAVAVEKTQYHAQDTLGQAAYGHSEAFQTHNAVQDAAGNKIGSYSYVAPNGQVVATSYVADALGYRVASNAAPVESAEVVAARAAHLHEVEVVKHRNRRSPVYAAYGAFPYSAYRTPYAAYHGVSPVVARTAYAGHVVSAPHAYAGYRYY